MAELNPDDHTVTELKEELVAVENPSELETVLAAEQDGKDRKTAKEAIQSRIDELQGELEDGEPAGDADSEEEYTETAEDAEPESEADEEELDDAATEDEVDAEDESGADDESEEEDDGLTHPTADKKYADALVDGVYRDMWVYCESHDGELLDVSKEMLGKARTLMDKYAEDYGISESHSDGSEGEPSEPSGGGERVVGVLVGDDVSDLAEEAIAYGADVAIYQEEDRLARFQHKPYTEIVADMVRTDGEWRDYDKARYFLFPATNNGRDLSAQVQGELDSGLASDCNELYIENNLISNPVKTGEPGEKVEFERVLHMKRPDFSGFEWSTILCLDNPEREFHPQGCSVIPGSFPVPERDPEREGLVVEHDLDLPEEFFRVEVVDHEELDAGVDLTGYDVVVALGRGIGDDPTTGIELGLDLVDQFEDAELGLSRGVVTASYQVAGHVEDYVEETRQIGETGQVVEPKLYIAAGISGAIQHKVGMDESDTIVAVNTDPDAAIKDFSDYFIVGDLFDVLPRLTEALESGELPEMQAAADGGER